MGGSQSLEEDVEANVLLPQLLETNADVDWQLVRRCLRRSPEQACLYAHGVEPSMLLRAIQRSAPVDVVELLIDSDEDAKDQISASGETVLHSACNNSAIASLLLKRCPGQASTKDHLGRLPLHLCTNVDAAHLLIQAYPAALAVRSGEFGSLPLHCALAQERLDVDLLRALGDQSLHLLRKGGVLARDKKGKTPLLQLLDRLESDLQDDLWNVLREWMARFCQGGLELHTHIEYGCCKSQRLMEKALESFPTEEIMRRDKWGRTPLHLAAINGECDADALETLIKANPKAPRMTDNDGRLPIDVAAESPNTKPQCLALLMKGEPRAISTRDLKNLYYPFLTSALAPEQNATNTYFLLRAQPEVLAISTRTRPEVLAYYQKP